MEGTFFRLGGEVWSLPDHSVERGHLVGQLFEHGCGQVFGTAQVLVEGHELDDVSLGGAFGAFQQLLRYAAVPCRLSRVLPCSRSSRCRRRR